MKLRNNHNFTKSRESLERHIARIKNEIENHIRTYSSEYGGYYDSFERKAPSIYIKTKTHSLGVRAVNAGKRTKYGHSKKVVYLTTPRLMKLILLLKEISRMSPTEVEIAKRERLNAAKDERQKQQFERKNFLCEIGFSDEFAEQNHSTKAAIALHYLANSLDPIGDNTAWRELYSAIEANIANQGKAYRAWTRDELSDYDFVNCVRISYRRHAETDYDDLLREFRQMGFQPDEAREIARSEMRGI